MKDAATNDQFLLQIEVIGHMQKFRIQYHVIWLAVSATQAQAADWPATILCEFTASQTCESVENCFTGRRSAQFSSNWRLELSQNSFQQFQTVDGRELLNFSGKIVHQRKHDQNPEHTRLSLVLDNDTLITVTKKFDRQWRHIDGQFDAVVQFARPGGSDTHWLSCQRS